MKHRLKTINKKNLQQKKLPTTKKPMTTTPSWNVCGKTVVQKKLTPTLVHEELKMKCELCGEILNVLTAGPSRMANTDAPDCDWVVSLQCLNKECMKWTSICFTQQDLRDKLGNVGYC